MTASKKGKMLKAPVSEIFFSYQGEGIFVGQPQIFVRFSGCNLRCDYCDTVDSQRLSESQEYYSAAQIIAAVKKLAKANNLQGKKGSPVTVSLTGGEPLLYSGFLAELMPALKKEKFNIYLETNATFPDALPSLLKYIDIVSADIKLPSACGETFWKEHADFFKKTKAKLFVKLILTGKTTTNEVKEAIRLVKSAGRDINFVLQPSTPVSGSNPVKPEHIFEWSTLARKDLPRVYVLPQMHKLWNIR
jgi:7-carboxy-7-deazaguanine synthase